MATTTDPAFEDGEIAERLSLSNNQPGQVFRAQQFGAKDSPTFE
jgi:hypothetical protein